MALSVDIFMFSLPTQFFNRSFPLHLGITEEEVQKTSRKIPVNMQSQVEKKNKCVFQRLSVGSVRMSVDETKWPRARDVHSPATYYFMIKHPSE
jgi:hypothetical protein